MAPAQRSPRQPAQRWVHDFKHAGRRYRLYKEVQSRDAPWYIHFQRDGRRIRRSLETNQAAVAVKRAIHRLIEPAIGSRWGEVDALKPTQYATVGEVIEAYQQIARAHVKPRTVSGNISMLRMMLRTVASGEPDNISTRSLTGKTVREYLQRTLDRRLQEADDDEDEPEIRRRTAITGNSCLRQARSIFARRYRSRYQDRGLVLPSLEEFMSEPGLGRAHTTYQPPSEEVLQATWSALPALREADRNAYLAVILSLACGLRRSEIARARWEHLVRAGDGSLRYQTETAGKDGRPIMVPIVMLQDELLEFAREAGYIIEGSRYEREDEFSRRVSAWMESLGWKTSKRLHALRAYAGCRVLEKYGVYTASQFLRHKDVRTTQEHYAYYIQLHGLSVEL